METNVYQMLTEAREYAQSYAGMLHNAMNSMRATGGNASAIAYLYSQQLVQVRTLDTILREAYGTTPTTART